ncbi:MAG: hypothetical protein HUJ79_00705, partial [Firmicutes bacterium]|nr:hypothetical protein [Bacillota bacterium]
MSIQPKDEKVIVVFLGPLGTFSHKAATSIYKRQIEFAEKESVGDVLEALNRGECNYAVVPVENTIGGLAGDFEKYLNMILDCGDVSIVYEVNLPIRQTLMGLPGTNIKDIRKVYSHPQGLAQGKEWMKENLPGVETVEVDSTAEGARIVSETQDPSWAAIAAPSAAEVFNLQVLAENIQIITTNVTRFYVLTKGGSIERTGDHALISVKCGADKIPALMGNIDKNGCRLVSIHERSAKTILGEYQYIIELDKTNEKA